MAYTLLGISVVNYEVSSCSEFQIFRRSAPEPAGEAYSAPQDPLAGGEGARCPLPRTTPDLGPLGLKLRASSFGASGRSFVPLSVREKNPPPKKRKINLD